MVSTGDHLGQTVDRSAAVIFSAAVGWALFASFDRQPVEMQWTATAAGAAASFWAAFLLLRRVSRDRQFPLSDFAPVEFDYGESVEREVGSGAEGILVREPSADEEELLLDDALDLVSDQSQVIRLFDPAQMPTAGELQERIDRHLGSGPRAVPDSTNELYAALSALRQTLR